LFANLSQSSLGAGGGRTQKPVATDEQFSHRLDKEACEPSPSSSILHEVNLKARGVIALLALVLVSCASRNISVISGRTFEVAYPPRHQHVIGEDCAYNVFGVPISGTSPPSIHQAIDNAASVAPTGDMITDMSVHSDMLVTLAYNQACLRVVADAMGQTTGNRYLDSVQRYFDWGD
jgi:hypothetical protein